MNNEDIDAQALVIIHSSLPIEMKREQLHRLEKIIEQREYEKEYKEQEL